MLLRILKSAFAVKAGEAAATPVPRHEIAPVNAHDVLSRLMKDPLVVRHLEVLFQSVEVKGRGFLDLYAEALHESRTGIPVDKWYRRAQRALNLVKFFESSLGVEGARAECGVFSGFSALLLCKTAGLHLPGYQGEDFHLFDSFQGLSDIRQEDLVYPGGDGSGKSRYSKGDMSVPLQFVRDVFKNYPRVATNKGWIPGVFANMPERRWSFVHIDVDLYEPTLGSLEYFYPRMSVGGVMVNDDYSSPDFPGAGAAWDEFCRNKGARSLALDTGQAVIVK